MKKTKLLTLVLLLSGGVFCQQLQNPGFEEWESIGATEDEPVNWSSIKTSDNIPLNAFAPIVWGKSTDAHSGNYSLLLFNYYVSLINNVAAGTITNGQVHSDFDPDSGYVFTNIADEQWYTAFNKKPDSIAGWFKCNPADGDFGTVKFLLHKGYSALPGDESNYIAIAYYQLPSHEVTEWTRFSTPFVYTSDDTPEYILSVITSGNGTDAIEGSTAHFDDFELIYNPSSVNDEFAENINIYQSNGKLVVKTEDVNPEDLQFTLLNSLGESVIKNVTLSNNSNYFDINNFKPGVYIAVTLNKDSKFSKKIVIN